MILLILLTQLLTKGWRGRLPLPRESMVLEGMNDLSKEICTERYDDALVDLETSKQTNGYVCSNREQRE